MSVPQSSLGSEIKLGQQKVFLLLYIDLCVNLRCADVSFVNATEGDVDSGLRTNVQLLDRDRAGVAAEREQDELRSIAWVQKSSGLAGYGKSGLL